MSEDWTALLNRAADGEAEASGRLFELLYVDLRDRAGQMMRGERSGHTLQPTALVHEAFARIITSPVAAESRLHFLKLAAGSMRRVLVDHARRRNADKRGGGAHPVTLSTRALDAEAEVDLFELEDALQKLATLDERAARIVELKLFAGLTEAEIAAELATSERTVRYDWSHARAWIHRELFPNAS